MSASRKPPTRQTSAPRNMKRSEPAATFNGKEVMDFLASRVTAAQETAVPYKGEQKAWGGARQFVPVNDDFLNIVQMAMDDFTLKQSAAAAQ